MISFVYFDVGGVVIKDFSATDKFKQLNGDLNLTEEFWNEHERDICLNKYPIEPSIVDEFVKRFEKNESIWPVIEEAKKYFRIGLLTNMYPGMFAGIKNKGLLPNIDWEIIIDSSIEGVAKPNLDIYQLAQTRTKLKPEELLFIDNAQKNLDAPKSLGWQTFYYDSHDYEQSSKNLLEYIEHEFKE